MPRVFFSDQVSFTYLATPDVQVDGSVLAYIYLNGSSTPNTVLALAPGQIVEEEFTPGSYRYNIGNFEVPNNTTAVEVRWHAYVSSNQVDTFPLVTNPVPTTTPAGVYLELLSSDPVSGSVGVDVRGRFILTFNEAVDPARLVIGQMFLMRVGSTSIAKVSAFVNPNDNTQLVLDPNNKLNDNTSYQLHIPVGTIKGVSGAVTQQDIVIQFKSGEDNFQTLHQATSEGVVERAGPLKIVVPGLPGAPSVGMVSSTPSHKSCNQSTREIVIQMAEAIDPYHSDPVLELNFSPLYTVANYHISKAFWGKFEPDPPHPSALFYGGGRASRGTVVFHDNPLDGETIEIGDGVISEIFEFDNNASVGGGNVAVPIGVDALETLGNLITEIQNSTTLTLTVLDDTFNSDPTLLLINENMGVQGDVPIASTLSDATVTGMDGGVDVPVGSVTTYTIQGDKIYITLNRVPTGNAYLNLKLTGLVTLANRTPFDEVEIDYITGLWPYRCSSAADVRRKLRRYISQDLTDCDISVLLTQIALDYYEIYKNEALPFQCCAITAEVLLLLLEDYIEVAGLDGMKSLGPFTVSRKSGAFMQGPYKRWQEALEECLATLNAYFNRPVTGIKSSNNILERPTGKWRIRTWSNTTTGTSSMDENTKRDRQRKLPPKGTPWS